MSNSKTFAGTTTGRKIEADTYSYFIGLDVSNGDKAPAVINLPHAEARALGEWLLENTPEPPKPKTTAEQIRDLDFGTVFDISGAPRLTFVKLEGDQFWASDEGGRMLELPATRWTERYDTAIPREV